MFNNLYIKAKNQETNIITKYQSDVTSDISLDSIVKKRHGFIIKMPDVKVGCGERSKFLVHRVNLWVLTDQE